MKMRNKLLAATAMLIVSAIMMTTASFAWFSISTAPEAKVQASTVVNENLEIALSNGATTPMNTNTLGQAADYTTWGSVVDMSSIANLTLKPVQVQGANLYRPTYTGGRPNAIVEATDKLSTFAANTDNPGVRVYKLNDNEGSEVWAVRVDLWLRTNKGGNLALVAPAEGGTDRGDGDGNVGGGSVLSAVGEGATLMSGIKVAIGWGKTTYNASAEGNSVAATTANVFDVLKFTELTVDEDGNLSLPADFTKTLDANKCYPVSVLLYLDGTTVSNADMAVVTNILLNIQFTVGNLNAMDPTK